MQTIEQSREMAKLACEALADKKGEGGRAVYSASIFPVGFNGGREYQAAAESGTAGLYRSTSRSHAESDREAL